MTRRAARSAASTAAPSTTKPAARTPSFPGSPGRRGGSAVPDATIEPDPGPPPEAVFDRLSGPYVRHAVVAMPGMRGSEDA